MGYSFRGIFPLASWNTFLWILEYRKINLNIYILEAIDSTGIGWALEALWLCQSALPKLYGDKDQADDGDSLNVHFDWSPLLTQATYKKASRHNVQFPFLHSALYLGDSVLRQYHISFNIKIIKEETFDNISIHSTPLKKLVCITGWSLGPQ